MHSTFPVLLISNWVLNVGNFSFFDAILHCFLFGRAGQHPSRAVCIFFFLWVLQNSLGIEEKTKMKKKGVSERIVPQKIENKSNHDQRLKVNRFLITITIPGSAGPIRFVVNENDLIFAVIDTALKSYAREGRLPVLGFDASNFFLYCANGFEALSPVEPIGSYESRNFVLAKRQACPPKTEGHSMVISRKRSGGWKAWLSKSLHFKISSHGHRDIIST